MPINMVYRAYRVPYDWVPQVDKPEEVPIPPTEVTTFRMPGAAKPGAQSVIEIEGTLPFRKSSALCVNEVKEE